ncbi:site-specific integrase, partial [Alicyclobacillus fastidiosus]
MRGHVRKRGNKWCFVIDVGKDENGKRIRKWFSGFETKKEAERAMAAKINEVESGGYIDPTKETIEQYFKRWLSDKQAQIRHGTYRKYAWLVNRHIIPGLGNLGLSDLKPFHLQSFYTKLSKAENPLSNRSILHAHLIIHEALDRAVKWGLVARNVSDAVDPPRVEPKRGQVWTAEQALHFLNVTKREPLEQRYWIGFLLAIMTGMRKGEILALKWEDIDWETGFARINRTLTFVSGEPLFQEPKTDRGRRSIALSPETMDALKHHKTRQARERLQYGPAYRDHDLVIAREDGRPMFPRTFDGAWYRSIERAQVPKIRFHDLRHTHASLLLQQGVHPKVVSERLGHSTINITLDIYSHVLPSLQNVNSGLKLLKIIGRKFPSFIGY